MTELPLPDLAALDDRGDVWRLQGVKLFSVSCGFSPENVRPRAPRLVRVDGKQRWAVPDLLRDTFTLYRRRGDALRRRGGRVVSAEYLVNTARIA